MRLEDRVREEIERVHAFIAAWFRGDLPESEEAFRTGLTNVLDWNLVNVQPSGEILTRDGLVAAIRKGYGANPEFQIEISEVAIRSVHDRGQLVLATYLESQRGARNTTPPNNLRRTTVLMGVPATGNPIRWRHLHETGLVRDA